MTCCTKVILAAVSIFLFSLMAHGAQTHEVFFQGTDHRLDVYRINGEDPGPTLMIMGGIQGDEPGGYLAADLYADMSLKQGNLIVVPRANLYSIMVNERGPNGDMNRKFAEAQPFDPDSEVVKKIKAFMDEADYFLNLHDGSGFYHPDYIDNMRNPRRFGQCIITDTDRYITPSGETYDLQGMSERVIAQVNTAIHEQGYHFHYNNHRTSATDSLHKEQRKSATYYMLTRLHKPAFASETSKSIRDFRDRVVFQTMVVNAFMKEFGIVPAQPSIYIEPPKMEYALISLNNGPPIAVRDQEQLVINQGDTVRVTDIKSNYKRGVVADIKRYGNINDTGRELAITESTTIEIRKDMFPCGQIFVEAKPPIQNTWLIVEANGVCYALEPEESLSMEKGSVLVIKELVYRGSTNHAFVVNFKGFVSNWNDNTGEDRGYEIHTGRLLTRYAEPAGAGTDRYRISVMRHHTPVMNFYVDLKASRP
ncbi:MAG: M14/M99 family metallopeptidase [Desulfomonilia bacterium]